MGLSWTRRFRDECVRFERLCSTTSVKQEPPWAESSLRSPGALKSVLTTCHSGLASWKWAALVKPCGDVPSDCQLYLATTESWDSETEKRHDVFSGYSGSDATPLGLGNFWCRCPGVGFTALRQPRAEIRNSVGVEGFCPPLSVPPGNDSPMKTHDWTEITKREESSTVTKNHEKKMNPVQFFHRRE